MSVIAEEEVLVAVERDRIWPVFGDAAALARILPGCERLEAAPDGSLHGILASRLQFLTIRAEVVARLVDLQPPSHLQLELDGRPRGLAGGFRAIIPIDLVEVDGRTRVRYRLELTTSGRLATFGAPLMRDTFRRQVSALVRNLELELADSGGEPPSAGSLPSHDR